MSKVRLGLLAAIGVTMAGCGLPPALMVASYVAEGILVATSGKTLGGHALSTVTQQDCAMWRILQGEDICQDPTLLDEAEIMLASGAMPATGPISGGPLVADNTPAPLITDEDPAAIQLAQVYLNNFGYGAGPIDGIAGPKTLAAVQAYGADMGRQTGAALTYDDLDFLSDQFAAAPDGGAGLVDDRTTIVLLAQAHLSYFGYLPGPLDGISGPTTRRAIARFQHDKGMEPDGEASNNLLTILRSELPDWSSPAIAATPHTRPARVTANAG